MQWISDLYKEIPSNCVFNKVKTGCGGTTLEIRNMNRDSIIAVPFVALIKNKLDDYAKKPVDGLELLGFYSGVDKGEILAYIGERERQKIICTWDSLPKVMSIIRDMKYKNLEDYFLLVDEVHCMLNQYTFRKEAIDPVLENYRDFNNWCFMTATPPKEDVFMLEELKHLRREVAKEMASGRPEDIEIIETYHIMDDARRLVTRFLAEKPTNAHIFVNSIKFIEGVIKRTPGLTENNCKIVWSENNPYDPDNPDRVCGIGRSKAGDPAKKINFYTSTAFEGCDIFDEEGETIVVADGFRNNTLNDIDTTFVQIAGRIRNSRFKEQITLLYMPGRHDGEMTLKEYKEQQDQIALGADNKIEEWYKDPARSRKDEQYLNRRYISMMKDGSLKFDANLLKIELLNYKNSHHTYASSDNLSEAIRLAGMDPTVTKLPWTPAMKLFVSDNARTKFEEVCRHYIELRGKFTTNPVTADTIRRYETKYPELKEAYDHPGVGPRVMAELKYNQRKINRKLIVVSPFSHQNKIKELFIARNNPIGKKLSRTFIKNELSEIYQELDIKKAASALDLHNYFHMDEAKVTENGERVPAFFIRGERPEFIPD